MICRIWHGWTRPTQADAYEALLREEVFREFGARLSEGYRGVALLRRAVGDEVEFVVLMWFDSLDVVRTFAGPDYRQAVIPAAARPLLVRFDAQASHFEVRATETTH